MRFWQKFLEVKSHLETWISAENDRLDSSKHGLMGAKVHTRIGWLIVIVGFFGLVIWAAFAPIDRGVPAVGTIINDGQRKVIQAVDKGVIDDILVKNGDVVAAGQVLVQLNSLDALAQYNGNKETITGLKARIEALQQSISSRRQELAFLKEQLSGMRTLAKEGYVAKNRLLDLERTYANTLGQQQKDEGDLEVYRHQLFDLQGKLSANEFNLQNTEINSPVSGSVVNLNVFTKGQVVQPGEKIMEIVPNDQPFVVKAQVPVRLIDRVRPGLKAKILFTAFNQRTTPKVPAVVTVVPEDRTEDKANPNNAYYEVKLEMDSEALKLLKGHEIRAGMDVQVFIITGERTMLNYLFKPLLDRAESSLGEE